MRAPTKNEIKFKPLDRTPAEIKGRKELLAVWKRNLPRFDSAAVSWDQQGLAIAYCEAELNRYRAQLILDREGLTRQSSRGQEMTHPQFSNWHKATTQLAKYAELLELAGQIRKYGNEKEDSAKGKTEAGNLVEFGK